MIASRKTVNYRRVLKLTWRGDASLLTRYHALAPCTLAHAVRDSANVLTTETGASFVFYELLQGDATVGFFGIDTGTNDLVTFGLHADFRTADTKAVFWEQVRTFTDASRPVRAALHAHNARARRFIEAAGGQLTQTIEHKGRFGVLYSLNF